MNHVPPTLHNTLSGLSPDHREALLWFQERAGTEIKWPEPLPSGLFLVNKAKGIHKPSGWQHALSVRQSLAGPYEDGEIQMSSDGSWSLDYFQEGTDPSLRDTDYTNKALMRNLSDGVPVGIIAQTKKKPNPRYRVIGLARVSAWDAGYFKLIGCTSEDDANLSVDTPNNTSIMAAPAAGPLDIADARKRINAAIVARQGAGAFRKTALSAFQGRCVVTGFDVPEVLEAAHIVPYLGTYTNVLGNTLLLRADIHTLFDRGLLKISSTTLKIELAEQLKSTAYAEFHDQKIVLPFDDEHPWTVALQQRNSMAD